MALLGEVGHSLRGAAAGLAHHQGPTLRDVGETGRQVGEGDVLGALDVAVLPLDRLAHVEDREVLGQRVGDAGDRNGGDFAHGARVVIT